MSITVEAVYEQGEKERVNRRADGSGFAVGGV